MPNVVRNWWWEALCVLVYFGIAGTQLFTTPVTGIADNGDFAKVLGRSNVCDPSTDGFPTFLYIYSAYKIDPQCDWDSGVTSSETLAVRVITRIATWSGRNRFSIDGAGKFHLLVALASLLTLLWALHDLRPAIRYVLTPLLILIFSDVAYVGYFNSFYMDAASMVFLFLTVSLAVAAVLRPTLYWMAIPFGIASTLFITSKSQHALTGALISLLAIWLGIRGKNAAPGARWRWWILSSALALVSTVIMFGVTDIDYKVHPLYDLIFFRLTTRWPSPEETLAELGLPPADMALVGTHSYSPNAPTSSGEWEVKFLRETSYLKLMLFYVHHPDIALDLVWMTLRDDGSGIRPNNLANYRKEDGFPPGTLARRFNWWSTMRSSLLRIFPVHVIIFYAFMLCGSLACLFQPTLAAKWPLYPIVFLLSAGGFVEFSCASLLDCVENARHLFVFHVITELLIVFALAAIVNYINIPTTTEVGRARA